MVEVKSTEKFKFKCSRTDIERRKRFADRYSLPLMYAIRFTIAKDHAYWIMVSAKDLDNKNRIDTSDYADSIGQLIFDTYGIITNSNYTFVRRYSRSKEGVGEHHEQLGVLQSVELISEEGNVYRPEPTDSLILAMLYNVFGSATSYTETYQGGSVVYSGFRLMNSLILVGAVYYFNNIISDYEWG